MLIFGHRYIQTKPFYHVMDIDSILKTPPSSVIVTDFDEKNLDIINHTTANNIKLAIYARDIKEILFSSSLGANYIIVDKDNAKTAHNLATNYLFDAKILVFIEDEDDIDELALLGIDGVIFADAIIKINS